MQVPGDGPLFQPKKLLLALSGFAKTGRLLYGQFEAAGHPRPAMRTNRENHAARHPGSAPLGVFPMLNLLKRFAQSISPRQRPAGPARAFRPTLESLDERCLPSATGLLSAVTDYGGVSHAFTIAPDHTVWRHDDNSSHNSWVPLGSPNWGWLGASTSSVGATLDLSTGTPECFAADNYGDMWLWSQSGGWQNLNAQMKPGMYSADSHGYLWAVSSSNQVYRHDPGGSWTNFGAPLQGLNVSTNIVQISAQSYTKPFVETWQYIGGSWVNHCWELYTGTGNWTNTGTSNLGGVYFTQISAVPNSAQNYSSLTYDCFGVDQYGFLWRHDTYGGGTYTVGSWERYDTNHIYKQISVSGGSNLVAVDYGNNVYTINQTQNTGAFNIGVGNTVVADTGDNTFYTLNKNSAGYDAIDEFNYALSYWTWSWGYYHYSTGGIAW
jgi:hypothetical protein